MRWQFICLLIGLPLLVDRHLALLGRHPLLQFSAMPNHNPVRFLDAACLGYLAWCVPRTVDLKLMKVGFCPFRELPWLPRSAVVGFSLLITAIEKHAMADSPEKPD